MNLATAAASLATVLAVAGVALHGVALARLRKHLAPAGEPPADSPLPPVTHWRTVKAGLQKLEQELEALIRAVEPGDQVLIGVDAGSKDAETCARVAARFPRSEVTIIPCERNRAPNPKVSRLIQMEPHARHALWMLTDSEVELDAGTVRAFREEWRAKGCDALTAGYRFAGVNRPLQALDSAPVLLTLWPGLMHVPRFDFTLGACTAVKREDIARIGGWVVFANDLAEDRQLGLRLAALGSRIALSRVVITLDADPMTLGAWLRHQHRVAVTYRKAAPAGALGMPVMRAFPLALLAWALAGGWWALVPLAVWLARTLLAARMAALLGIRIPALPLVLPIATVVEDLCWLVAWLPLPIWWAGKWRRLR